MDKKKEKRPQKKVFFCGGIPAFTIEDYKDILENKGICEQGVNPAT